MKRLKETKRRYQTLLNVKQSLERAPSVEASKQICTSPRNIADILSSDSWKGCSCFLVGGGPSLRDFDFKRLQSSLTIGVNKAFVKFSPTINYSMDARFYNLVNDPKEEELFEPWRNYHGIKVFLSPLIQYHPGDLVYVVNKMSERTISRSLSKGIYHGNNSGFGAMMLAIALGANPIYLLGYDMRTDEKGTHWHKGYGGRSREVFQTSLNKYARIFFEFASRLDSLGIKIVSLSPSALTCFSASNVNSVLPRFSNQEKTNNKPVYISYYTVGTRYEDIVRRLIKSFEVFNLEHEVVGIKSLGSWDRNTKYKPMFIRTMLNKHFPRPVVFCDADSEVCRYPDLFDDFPYDFGIHLMDHSEYFQNRNRKELLSGTMYVGNNDRTRTTIAKWISACSMDTGKLEQRILQEIIRDGYYNIPAEYCTIFDFMSKVKDPVIKQYQASRLLRKSSS